MKQVLATLGLLCARLFIAGIFGWAAVVKLGNIPAFGDAVKGFKIFGRNGYYGPKTEHMNILTTFAVPWLEIICAVLLVLGVWTRAAALLMWLLTVSFIIAIMSVLYRGIDVKCGCFGDGYLLCPGSMSLCHVIQNTLILAVISVTVAFGGGRASLDWLCGRGSRRDGPHAEDRIEFRPL